MQMITVSRDYYSLNQTKHNLIYFFICITQYNLDINYCKLFRKKKHFSWHFLLYKKVNQCIVLHCVKFQLKWINIIEMRAKTVRQRIEKKACFRDQLLKNSSQTALYLSYGFCSHFQNTCPFWLKPYTVQQNGPGKLSIKSNYLPKMPRKTTFFRSKCKQ